MRTGVKILALSLCFIFLTAPMVALPLGADTAPTASSRAVTYQPDRVVVGELFTGTWCGYCRYAEQAMDIIVDDTDYFDKRFVVVEWHSGDSYECPDSAPRATYYSVSGYPTARFDGVQEVRGAGSTDGAQTAYEGKIDGRSEKADLFVEIDSALTNGDTQLDVWINLTAFNNIALTNQQMRAVLIEDEDFWDGQYPIRMTARGWIMNEATSITTKDQVVSHSGSIALDPSWVLEDLAVVAWVQSDTNKEIINGNINHIEINDPVTKSGDPAAIVMDEDVPDSSLDLDDYFTDPEGEDLPWKVEGNTHLTIDINANNVVTITPEAEWSGSEHLVIWANDKYNIPKWTEVDVTVNNVNDPPIITGSLPDQTLLEEQVKDVFDLDDYFSDIDDVSLTYSFSGNDQVTIVINSGVVKMTAPSGTPPEGLTETVTFKATDAGAAFIEDTIIVKVDDVNYPPKQDKQFSTLSFDEDGVQTIDLKTYFSDEDDTLVFGVTGNLHLDVNIGTDGVVTLTPEADWHGEEQLTVTADDGTNPPISAEFSVVVNPVNDLPELTGTEFAKVEFDEDEEYTTLAAVSALFTDKDGDTLLYTVEGSDDDLTISLNQDLTVKFEPDKNWYGIKTYVIKAKDSEGFAQYDATVEVLSVNDPVELTSYTPLVTNIDIRETDSVDFNVVATDPDGIDPNYVWTIDGTERTDIKDSYTFETDYTSSGTHVIKVKVTDGETEETVSWTIKVKDLNRLPVVTITAPSEGAEFDVKDDISFEAETSDADGDTLTVKWYDNNKPIDTNLQFTTKLVAGEHTIKVVVTDGKGGQAEQTININVKGKQTTTTPTGSSGGLSGALIGAIIAVVIVVLVITLVMLKMRGKKGPETIAEEGQTPPPPPPPGYYDQGQTQGYEQGYGQDQGYPQEGYPQDPYAQQQGYDQNQYQY